MTFWLLHKFLPNFDFYQKGKLSDSASLYHFPITHIKNSQNDCFYVQLYDIFAGTSSARYSQELSEVLTVFMTFYFYVRIWTCVFRTPWLDRNNTSGRWTKILHGFEQAKIAHFRASLGGGDVNILFEGEFLLISLCTSENEKQLIQFYSYPYFSKYQKYAF